MRRITITAASLAVFLPTLTLAQAWVPQAPYASGVTGPAPYVGHPGVYGPGVPPAPWSMPTEAGSDRPAAPGMPAPPAGFEPAPRPSLNAPGPLELPGRPAWPRLSLSRRATNDAYLIEIQLQNIEPDQVEVRPVGRGLVITHHVVVRSSQSEPLPGGDGYQSRYSLAHDTSSRRLGLPPDADLAGMTREVKDGRLLIRVPRVANAWGGWYW